jgi:predicted nucleic acid-binding protein
MTRCLLDSDAVIDYLKGFAPTVALIQRLNRQGDIPCVCAVVTGEIYAGLNPDQQAQAERFLNALEFLPTSIQAARQAGAWKYAYARQGTPLSMTDCLIAAVAYEAGAQLVTRNARDYPMPELTILPLPRPQRGGAGPAST